MWAIRIAPIAHQECVSASVVRERIGRVEPAYERLVLCGETTKHARKTALESVADEEEDDHTGSDEDHHETLRAVGQDVCVRAAERDVNHQDHGRNAERPLVRHSEHRLEHDEARDELAGEIEEEQQGVERDGNTQEVRLVALAQVLRN